MPRRADATARHGVVSAPTGSVWQASGLNDARRVSPCVKLPQTGIFSATLTLYHVRDNGARSRNLMGVRWSEWCRVRGGTGLQVRRLVVDHGRLAGVVQRQLG